MADANSQRYRHTQTGPWHWMLYGSGIFMALAVAGMWLSPVLPVFLPVLLLATAVMMIVLGASFQHLTVADDGDRLAIRFGPLPLFAKRIRYEDMQGAEPGRTTVLDGWGVRFRLSGEAIWNIRGRDCVVIRHKGSTTMVGTDDPENLLRLLKSKLVVLSA